MVKSLERILRYLSYEEYGLREPEIIEGENFVKCILPRLGATKPRKKLKPDEEKLILDLFEKANELTMGEIVDALLISRSTASRRLEHLINKGIITKKGVGSGTRYALNE